MLFSIYFFTHSPQLCSNGNERTVQDMVAFREEELLVRPQELQILVVAVIAHRLDFHGGEEGITEVPVSNETNTVRR